MKCFCPGDSSRHGKVLFEKEHGFGLLVATDYKYIVLWSPSLSAVEHLTELEL